MIIVLSGNAPEFLSGDLKQWYGSIGIIKWNHPYII